MHRPAPVAHPAVTTLAAHPEEVAKRWLVTLVDAAPLKGVARIPLEAAAAEGPELCGAVLRALASEEALTALLAPPGEGPAAADLARLSGSTRLAEAVEAAECLRRAVADSVEAELPRADVALLARVGDRAAHVCAQLAAGASEAVAPVVARPQEAATPALGADPVPERVVPHPLRTTGEPPAPLWLAALERRLADGGRIAVLLLEIDGADRVRQSEGEEAAGKVFGRAGRAVRANLRRADLLAHEDGGRMWVVASDAGRGGAEALAARVADAVERTASLYGAPLTASVGVAVFPDDGRDAAALVDRAEENALAARAAGVRVAIAPPEGEEDAERSGPRAAR